MNIASLTIRTYNKGRKMLMRKYIYYFRKPRSEIVKDLLLALLKGGVLTIAATSPAFIGMVWKRFLHDKKYPRRKFVDTFTRLRRRKLLIAIQKGRDLE